MRRDLLDTIAEFLDGMLGAPAPSYDAVHPRAPRGQPNGGQWVKRSLHYGPGPHPDGTPQSIHAGGAQPPARQIRDLQGRPIAAPRVFYRGTVPGATQRISTGNAEWDSYLFAADNERAARNYGAKLQRVTAKPGAQILYEGTPEFSRLAKGLRPERMTMLEYVSAVAQRAKQVQFDAVWFKRQSDVGTAILNRTAFDTEEV